MTTFVALLRGVNVGGAKRVPMAELRALLQGLGHSGVATLLNSGNAVFRAAGGSAEGHAAKISEALATELKVDVPVIVKPARVLATIVAENILAAAAADHSRLLVAFARDRDALNALATVERWVAPSEQFLVGSEAAYLHCAGGILESQAGAALLGKAGRAATTRNWATVLKLQALADRAGP